MLCPEVWRFKAPKVNFYFEKGETNKNFCDKIIKKFYYNYSISLVLPGLKNNLSSVTNLLSSDSEYYKLTNLNLVDLISANFINYFVKKGDFTGLCINRRLDVEDCFCLTPTGVIILSLTKSTFESLGLEGKPSVFSSKTKNRYMI